MSVWFLFMAVYLMSCTPSRHVKIESQSRTNRTISERDGKINEDFDPLSLPEEKIDFRRIKLPKKEINENKEEDNKVELSKFSSQKSHIESTENSTLTEGIGTDTLLTKTPEREVAWGWRVQICALTDEGQARNVYMSALLKFDEHVYLTYDSPYYKVRIGDCLSRYEADELQRLASEKGFDDAWVVRTKVYKPIEIWQEKATRK